MMIVTAQTLKMEERSIIFSQYCEKSETKFKNLGWSEDWIMSFRVNGASVSIHRLNGYSELHPKCALDCCQIAYSEQN